MHVCGWTSCGLYRQSIKDTMADKLKIIFYKHTRANRVKQANRSNRVINLVNRDDLDDRDDLDNQDDQANQDYQQHN